MADYSTLPTSQLFAQWRSGDAQAGQSMAQRFSDWYYALTTSRLGDTRGRPPLERACVRFQQGILSVGTAAELVEWAHGIVSEEMRNAGGRIGGGDYPNALSNGRSPVDLVRSAARALPVESRKVLAAAYDASVPQEEIIALAEAQGGYPFAVLQARYALKAALRDHAGVPFTVLPTRPNLDAGPLPLYEGGRVTAPAEEAGFEKWVLSDLTLCKDIAEFSAFALALRTGALADLPDIPVSPRVTPVMADPAPVAPPAAAPAAPAAAPGASSSKLPLLIGGVLALLVILAILAFVAFTVLF